jgi:tRNA pseudouridine55 synthase
LKKLGADINGVILVDKPIGITSTGVVSAARRAFNTRRIGHAGTLDPDASGLLLLCVGQATRLVPYLVTEQKDYWCRAMLGTETVTDDAASEAIRSMDWEHVTEVQLEGALSIYRGGYDQTAPRVSALKKDGKRFHARVRAGEFVDDELPVRPVKVHQLQLESFDAPEFTLKLSVGKGFYVRSLVRDLGRSVDSAAHVLSLRRTRVGRFDVADATQLDALLEADVVSLVDALAHLPIAQAGAKASQRIIYGQKVPIGDDIEVETPVQDGEQVRVLNSENELLAIAECFDGGVLRVLRGVSHE